MKSFARGACWRITARWPRYAWSPHTRVSRPCNSSGSTVLSATLAGVAWTAWISLLRLSTPKCAFIPKYHWFPFFVWCISGSRAFSAFFVEDGALMIVASTIVPVATFSPLVARCRAPRRTAAGPDHAPRADGGSGTQSSRPAPARDREPALAKAGVDANKMPHRLRIVKRLFHCRVGQIEPVLQEIEAQHPLDPDRRVAIAWLRIKR